jgi:hypothetical protein
MIEELMVMRETRPAFTFGTETCAATLDAGMFALVRNSEQGKRRA